MATIEDIAKLARVSPATVSRVLNNRNSVISISEKTRNRVRSIAEELNYVPNAFAKSLRTRKSNIVGVVVWDLQDPYYLEILRGIDENLDKAGYNLLLNSAKENVENERICYDKLREIRAEGILIVGGPRPFHHRKLIEKLEKPVVFVGTRVDYPEASSVTVNNYHGGQIGAEYLVSLNRKQIIYMGSTKPTIDIEDRQRGFKEKILEKNFSGECTYLEVDPGEEKSYEAAMSFLKTRELPLAIFARNDVSAIGVIRAVNDYQLKIPEEVSVLGFDNLSLAEFVEPRISTIHQPRFEMGKKGSELLLDLINGELLLEEDRHITLIPKLILRKSA